MSGFNIRIRGSNFSAFGRFGNGNNYFHDNNYFRSNSYNCYGPRRSQGFIALNFRSNGHYNHNNRHDVVNAPDREVELTIKEQKELIYQHRFNDAKTYEKYLALAVREADIGVNVHLPETSAQAHQLRDREGQKLIGGKHLPFIDSREASDALNLAFTRAKGDADKLKAFEDTWREAGQYKRGVQRDQFIVNSMNELAAQWEKQANVSKDNSKADSKAPAETASLSETGTTKALAALLNGAGHELDDQPAMKIISADLKSHGVNVDNIVEEMSADKNKGKYIDSSSAAELIIAMHKAQTSGNDKWDGNAQELTEKFTAAVAKMKDRGDNVSNKSAIEEAEKLIAANFSVPAKDVAISDTKSVDRAPL